MKKTTLFGALLAASVHAVPIDEVETRDVDTRYPYTGPAVPVGDCKLFLISVHLVLMG